MTEEERESYLDAADDVGGQLLRMRARPGFKGYTAAEADMVVRLAQLEQTERLAEATEALAGMVGQALRAAWAAGNPAAVEVHTKPETEEATPADGEA